MFNLFRIHSIRQYLTQEATQVLVSSLVMSHIDYANSLLVGLPQCDIQKLQTIQDMVQLNSHLRGQNMIVTRQLL